MDFLFVELDNEELPNEPLPLKNANAFLQDLNEYLKEKQEIKEYPFELIYDGDVLYKSSIRLPVESSFSLREIIESELESLQNKEATDFLKWLQPFFDEQTESEQVRPRPKKKKSTSKPNLSLTNRKVIFFVLLLIGVGLFALFRPSSGEEKPSYTELISSKDYLVAGKEYPKKHVDIEQTIYESILEKRTDTKISQLKQFNDKYPTVFGNFDLAIFNKEYEIAIKYFEDDPSEFKNDKERMVLVGYSYLKEDRVIEAKEISGTLKSIELEKKIYDYEKLKGLIEEKEKELKELEKGGSKNREKAEEVAAEKFDLQEQLVNL